MVTWLDEHEALVVAASAVVVALVAVVLALLVMAALRQGRRAMLGARPVVRPPSFVPGENGRLVLVVPMVNLSEWPATDLRVEAKADGKRIPGGAAADGVFGVEPGPLGEPGEGTARFDWPVGVLESEVRLRWRWRDGSGTHSAEWRGHLRVPEPALPGPGAAGAPPVSG